MLGDKNRSLFFTGFVIIIFKRPLQYLLGDLRLPILAAGVGLCVLASLFIFNEFRFGKDGVLLQLLLAAIFILHGLLAFAGVTASRSLWFSGLARFFGGDFVSSLLQRWGGMEIFEKNYFCNNFPLSAR